MEIYEKAMLGKYVESMTLCDKSKKTMEINNKSQCSSQNRQNQLFAGWEGDCAGWEMKKERFCQFVLHHITSAN